MQASAGARRDVPFFLILLTDGKSQDDAVAAANRLKSIGVEIIAVGERERQRESTETALILLWQLPVKYFTIKVLSIKDQCRATVLTVWFGSDVSSAIKIKIQL